MIFSGRYTKKKGGYSAKDGQVCFIFITIVLLN